MKNGEFLIKTKEGVVVFAQQSHGEEFTSACKARGNDKFNIGIGQLIAMKRNEIQIRRADLRSMRMVSRFLDQCNTDAGQSTAAKLFAQFKGVTDEKINASLNHIHELDRDLETIYEGKYDVKPWDEIRAERSSGQVDMSKPYAVPAEIVAGTHIYRVVNGSTTLVELPQDHEETFYF